MSDGVAGERTTLPANSLTDDVVDRIAAEIGLIVADHIETMYPAAAEAVSWNSAKRSIQGTIRNSVRSAGRAAERGRVDEWIASQRKHRRDLKKMRARASGTDGEGER